MKNEEKSPEEGTHETAAPQPEGKPKKKHRIRKIVGWIFGVLFLLLLIAFFARDILIESAIAKVGSMATGTKVSIGSFSSSVFKGEVELTNFQIANPPGYKNPDAFQVARVKVRIQPASLFSDVIVIDEILIDGTKVNFEVLLTGQTNLTDIQKNIEAFAGTGKKSEEPTATGTGAPQAAAPTADQQSRQEAAQKKVVIHQVKVDGSELSLSSAFLASNVVIPLPNLTLTELGAGKTLGETINDFFVEVLAAILKAASSAGINSQSLKALGDSLSQSGEALLQSVKDGGASLTDTGKTLEENAKGIGNEVKNLIDAFKKK